MNRPTSLLLALLAPLLVSASAHADVPPTHMAKVIAFGDSITYGTGSADPRHESWPALLGARRVAHAGAGLVGARAGMKPALTQYRKSVLTRGPDVVIVAYGMNDLIWSTTPEIIAGLRQVERWNIDRGIETWVATLTPLGSEIPWGLQPAQAELNRRIRATFPGQVIDFDAALADKTGALPARYDSGDGLHPNAAGYAKMAQFARRTMRD